MTYVNDLTIRFNYGTCANKIGPDMTPKHAASNLGLFYVCFHEFHRKIFKKNTPDAP